MPPVTIDIPSTSSVCSQSINHSPIPMISSDQTSRFTRELEQRLQNGLSLVFFFFCYDLFLLVVFRYYQ